MDSSRKMKTTSDDRTQPRLLSKTTVCKLLDNVTGRHIENLVKSGRMPGPVYLGRSPRWRLKELLEWIDSKCPVVDPGKLAQWQAQKNAGTS